jgi:hypothetical protein
MLLLLYKEETTFRTRREKTKGEREREKKNKRHYYPLIFQAGLTCGQCFVFPLLFLSLFFCCPLAARLLHPVWLLPGGPTAALRSAAPWRPGCCTSVGCSLAVRRLLLLFVPDTQCRSAYLMLTTTRLTPLNVCWIPESWPSSRKDNAGNFRVVK